MYRNFWSLSGLMVAFSFFLFLLAPQSASAQTQQWPASQCYGLGGSNALGSCSDIQNTFDAGAFLNTACQVSGRCCLPSGRFNASNPLPSPATCTAQTCAQLGGNCTGGGLFPSACSAGTTPAAGTCPGGQGCCIAGGGGACASQGGVCVSGTCASDRRQSQNGSCQVAGQSCCSAQQGAACVSTGAAVTACRTGSCPSGEYEDSSKTCTNPYQVCCSSGLSRVNAPSTGPYTLLERIPGSTNSIGNFRTYLEDIYRFAFWIIGIAVVLMLTIGGFMYLTSAGNTSRMESAKTVIFDAILGLCLALVAWLFLYVINPDLVNVTLPSSTPSAPTTAPPTTPPTGTPAPTGPAPGTAASYAQQILSGSAGVTAATGGDCNQQGGQAVSPQLTLQQTQTNGIATSCHSTCSTTNLCSGSTSLNTSMLRALVTVGSTYPFTLSSLTGGRHSANSAHYQGRAVDMVPSAPKAQWPAVVSLLRQNGSTLVFCDNAGANVPCDQASHIHAQW